MMQFWELPERTYKLHTSQIKGMQFLTLNVKKQLEETDRLSKAFVHV